VVGWKMWWGRWGCAFERTRGGGGHGLKKPKPSRWGSVSVVPCQTAVGGDSGRERGGVENVLQVVGVRVRARARGRGPRPKKTETDPLGLGFGCAVSNGGWGR
jgi:hypothetical protein